MPYRVVNGPKYVQLFFNDAGDKEGWSEGYWCKAGDYTQCNAFMQTTFIPARLGLMNDDIQLVQCRISDTSIRGDVQNFFPDPGKSFGTFFHQSSPSKNSLPGNLAIWNKWRTSDAFVHASRPLHGLPFDQLGDFPATRQFSPSSTFVGQFNKFVKAAKAGIQLGHRTVAGKRPRPGAVVFHASTDPTLIDGIDGNYWENFVTNVLWVKTGGVWGSLGSMVDTVTFRDVTAIDFPTTVRYRKIGRPFGLLQGRRSQRRR